VTPPAIEVKGVSKRFRLYREKPTSLKQRLLSSRSRAVEFWALRDVSFDVPQGSTLGLIGHNGSGKTTILKVIAGILRPTAGIVNQRGRLSALLELGAGFHPELTGRENVYLNASFLGLTRKDIDRTYDAIVDFAELEQFMDNQVKFYSSGMLVRLGFAVAVHVDPEVLLIDEVLAVGDEAFQAKCIDRVRQFQRDGRTIILVTHALGRVTELCDRTVMLHHGVVHKEGTPDDVVREMRYVLLGITDPNFVPEEGSRAVEIVSVDLVGPDARTGVPILVGDALTIQVDVRSNRAVDDLDVDFQVLDGATNHSVLEARTSEARLPIASFDGKKRVRFVLEAFPYQPGKYWVTIGLSSSRTGELYHVQTQRYAFDVVDAPRVQDRVDVPVRIEVDDL
jgi:ABC-type polysaccharide/polyol phosphate transport system ATPase subunit